MALCRSGSVRSSCCLTPSSVQTPSSIRLGHGTRTIPHANCGAENSPYGSVNSTPPMRNSRIDAATSTIVASASPSGVERVNRNCSPVGARIRPAYSRWAEPKSVVVRVLAVFGGEWRGQRFEERDLDRDVLEQASREIPAETVANHDALHR